MKEGSIQWNAFFPVQESCEIKESDNYCCASKWSVEYSISCSARLGNYA